MIGQYAHFAFVEDHIERLRTIISQHWFAYGLILPIFLYLAVLV